jgi:Mor family transcriptional regulator
MPYKEGDREDFRRLYKTLLEEFGQERGLRIIEVLTIALGGRRFSLPGHRAIVRELRARRIQELYDSGGFTVSMLAQRFGISPRQVAYDLKRRSLVGGGVKGGHIAGDVLVKQQ